MNTSGWASVKAHNGYMISCLKCAAIALLDPSFTRRQALIFEKEHMAATGHSKDHVALRSHKAMLHIEDYPATASALREKNLITAYEFNLPQSSRK